MSRLSLAAILLISMPVCASAALDAQGNTPYRFNIVLRFADNRILTEVFKDRVRHELQEWFQGALGDMAVVEVLDKHPLLKDIESRGLEQALDGQLQPVGDWRPVNDAKTHFVLIDYVDGQYQIQARQQDGDTGLASPITRKARTSDRQFVARTAARLIEHDFGIVGAVEPGAQGQDLTVTLRGGGLGALDRWVRAGDVFAVARIMAVRGGETSYRVPWTLLQVIDEPKDGACHCRLRHRWQDPLAAGSTTLGYRCLKLGTTTAPLRMRLMNDKSSGLLNVPVRVVVSAEGFDATPRQQLIPSDDNNGMIVTDEKKPFENIAFVKVYRDNILLAQIPAEILGDRPLVCPISVSQDADKLADLDGGRRRLLSQINDNLALCNELFDEITQLVNRNSREGALNKAREGARDLEGEIKARKADLFTLKQTIREAKMEDRVPLDEPLARIQMLEEQKAKLETFCGNLKKAQDQVNDPNRRTAVELVQQAQLLEETADYGEAIKVYEEALARLEEGGQKPELERHVQELKRVWEKQSSELAEARKFIYQTWPALTSVKELSENLSKARAAFETCKNSGDYLTPRKLLLTFAAHGANLRKRIETLQAQGGQDAFNELKSITTLTADLEKLEHDAREYVRAASPTKK